MKFRTKVATVAAAGALAVLGTASAHAGNLKYYDANRYESYIGEFACNKTKVMHDVGDDAINSVKNETSCNFSARSWGAIPNTTIQVMWVASGTNYSTFGDRNNETDHFDRR